MGGLYTHLGPPWITTLCLSMADTLNLSVYVEENKSASALWKLQSENDEAHQNGRGTAEVVPGSPKACWVGQGKVANLLAPWSQEPVCTSESADRAEGSNWSVCVSSDLQQRRMQCLLHESCKQYVTLTLSLHTSFLLKLSSLQNVSALEMFVPAGLTLSVNLHRSCIFLICLWFAFVRGCI
jgi:hypothetical protein